MTNRYGSLTLQIKALSNLADVGSAYTDTLISASGTQELSKSGRGSFTVSARAYSLLTAIVSNMGQVAYIYITDQVASGAAMDVCAFIIQDIDISTADNGSVVTVSGDDILQQLTYATLLNNAIDDGAGGVDTTDIDDIMAYAPSGWTNSGGNTTNGTYHVSSGNNVLETLIAAAKQSGEMFRLSAISPPVKDVVWLASPDSSGITLRMPSSPISYDGNATTGIILSMRENNSFSQVVTRIRPFGAGLSDGRLAIIGIDSGDTGGDPTGYTTTFASNLIVNTALETSLGYSIAQDVDFSHIRPEDPTDGTQVVTAAVALWNEGINYLQERDGSNKVYDVDCIVPYDLKPGQSVTIVYTEYEGGITGGSAVWSVNDSFTIHSVTTAVSNSGDLAGVRTTALTVGETSTPRPTGASTIASAARTARETTRKTDVQTSPGAVPASRNLITTEPLRIDAGASADLSADRTLTVHGLTTVGTANQIPGTNAGATAWEYKTLTNGTGINITHGAGTVTITNTDPAAGLSALAFVTIGNTATLSGERALTAGDGIDITDAGANSTVTIAVDVTDILGNGFTESSNNIVLGTPSTLTVATTNGVTASSHTHAITSSSNPGAAASILATDASGYITVQRLILPNDTGYAYWANAAGTGSGGLIYVSASDDMALNIYEAGSAFNWAARNIADTDFVQMSFQDGGSGVPQLNFVGNGRLSASGSITVQPNAGSSLNVNLSTTGDFIVNTSQLVVDTSAGRVGIGIASSLLATLHIDQSSTTAAIPPILIDQADVSEEMIAFQTTVAAGNAMDSSAAVGTYWGKMRITINGVDKYMAIYNT